MTDQAFAGVRVVGGLLPADVLSRLVAARDVAGLGSGDFHLGSGESVREAANRSWSYLTGTWASYRAALEQLPETDRATSLTRDRWLQQLFGQLGFGRLPATPAGGIAADGKAFVISHRWEHVPVHLLGWRVELDRKTAGVAGASDAAPQSLVQECLNRSDEYLWAVLSNGRVLRLLRDSTSLVGSAYVEFDLEAIFDGELFSDFLLLFTLCHQSRFEQLSAEGDPAECWLERWRTDALESGTRALEQLRDGVREAIETLGTGFLQHPDNGGLREDLASGALSREDYRQALLRLVYRLLFLFVAEDRNALLDPRAPADARARYDGYFATARLRSLARRRRGGRHGDLWRALVLVTDGLGAEQGRPELGLPGIGGLFEPGALDFLSERELANEALLDAVRSLCLLRERRSGKLRVVDYRNLGAEELGSVYESLLEYVPQHDPGAVTFSLVLLSGNERKTTGSYYTPTSLIETLLDSALDPLLTDAMAAANPREALLSLTVCDPACGSGHFLVAAARRIAKRVATVDTGDPEPPPERVRAALREAVGRCLYGVDLNPLAADLAKVSLWLEAMEPGRPLAFLDAQIKVGNALLGTTPKLLADGISDDAFKPIEGDDKKVARSLLTQNRSERSGQGDLFAADEVEVGNLRLAERARAVLTGPAPSLADAHLQARRHRELESSPELHRARLVADAWCAAFVQPKTADAPVHLTHATLLALQADPGAVPEATRQLVTDLAARYRFFHWHLEFPHIFPVPAVPDPDTNVGTGWDGGFSCILGNPPFLNRLESATALDRRVSSLLERAFSGMLGAYTDVSAIFLIAASRLLALKGTVSMVQPQSFLAARDAQPIRTELARTCSLTSLWASEEPVFEASVITCGPTLHRNARQLEVARIHGPNYLHTNSVPTTAEKLQNAEWSFLLATDLGVPAVDLSTNAGVVSDIADCTADFREQYYGLIGAVVEAEPWMSEDKYPRLITSGLIDPSESFWGRTPTKFNTNGKADYWTYIQEAIWSMSSDDEDQQSYLKSSSLVSP